MEWKGCLPVILPLAWILFALTATGESKLFDSSWKCYRCNPGYYVTQICSSISSTRCAPCPAGTYINHFNRLFQCKRCSRCPVGFRQQHSCNRERDVQCVLSSLLKHLHGKEGFVKDEPAGPPFDDGSGDVAEDKGNQFSNEFSEKHSAKNYFNIPNLSKTEKVEQEPYQDLSGDSQLKPNLFAMDYFDAKLTKVGKQAKTPIEKPILVTAAVSEDTTTVLLPENEAYIDDLIPIQDRNPGVELTTLTVDSDVEGSATTTLVVDEYTEVHTETPVPPKTVESETPKSSLEPEIKNYLTTIGAALPVQVTTDGVTKSIVDTFNDIEEAIKQPVPTPNISEAVEVQTTPIVTTTLPDPTTVVTTTSLPQTEAPTTTEKQAIVPDIDSASELEGDANSDADSNKMAVTEDGGVDSTPTPTPVPAIDEPGHTKVVPIKKIVVQSENVINEGIPSSNKTQVAKIIPLESAGGQLQTTSPDEESETSPAADVGTVSSDSISAVAAELTTPEHVYPGINGSLLQGPEADNVGSKDSKHVDIAIAVVITGIGLLVLTVIGVRYFLKKRTFKDMRRSQDRMKIQPNEEKELKTRDSQADDTFQTAIYDDIELQAVKGDAKHLNGKANGHCKDSNATSNNEIMSAVNCNYRPVDDSNGEPNKSPADNITSVVDLYAVPNKLAVSEPAEPLLNGKPQTPEKGKTITTAGT